MPAGRHFGGGAGSIDSSGNTVTINQTSRGVVNWDSFSIGGGNCVVFANGNGATLNRVTGGPPSVILGSLTASGSVYLINPQGVLVGPGGTISTNGRFVASTLDADNTAFMNGGPLTLSGNSNAAVINLGSISSSGDDVFLVARNSVVNMGSVSAPNGTAELSTGQQVLLQDSSSSKQVFVQAGNGGTVVPGGTIEAKGGTVDMSADTFVFPFGGTTVNAPQWNISTPAFTVNSGEAQVLSANLGNDTSVNVQNTGANGSGGDINVNSGINWQGNASLTLAAYHSLATGRGVTIANQDGGNLTLRADAAGLDNGGSITNRGVIDWSRSTGIVNALSLYDMNGTYSAGTLPANSAWAAAPGSGQVTQITAYKLVNNVADRQSGHAFHRAVRRSVAQRAQRQRAVQIADFTQYFSAVSSA
ncbi:MAG: Large exoproteins involved in heme utilization or adhesion [uncultured Paraburkholderia sp.]|nr:MAG: Large exoproteins involved in heme utilization or adhesion [uncultured Paraburkholderia sp.]CAH2911672.1 MAG: Large exoproteins involved in heme utilization or adhesion [uncultured Paraburkholderia sp.]